jgi:hypothetical protein
VLSPTRSDKVFTLFSTAASYANAQSQCWAQGAELATVTDLAEIDAVVGLAPGVNLWVGLNDRDVEGTFVWADGSNSAYRRWQTGDPNDGGTGEDCVLLVGGYFEDWPCTTSAKFVCSTCGQVPCTQVWLSGCACLQRMMICSLPALRI